MMSHPLEATLAQLSQASRFTLTLGAPEGEGWFCPAELTDADHPAFAQIAARLAARHQTVTRRYTGLLIYSRCVWMLANVGLASLTLARRVPAVSLDSVRFHWHDSGYIDAVALATPRFYALPDDADAAHDDALLVADVDALRERFCVAYEEAVAAFVPAYRANSGLGAPALWAAASDACSYTLITALTALGRGDDSDAEVAAIIQRDGSRLNRRAGVLWVQDGPVKIPQFNRVGCCLWYTLPGNEDALCASCPLRPLEERLAMAVG